MITTFFFTEHYRNYPTVLIRLADVPPPLFADVVTEAHRQLAATPRVKRNRNAPS